MGSEGVGDWAHAGTRLRDDIVVRKVRVCVCVGGGCLGCLGCLGCVGCVGCLGCVVLVQYQYGH